MTEYIDYPVTNTFGIPAKAARFVEYADVDELRRVLENFVGSGSPEEILHVGAGSNLLFLSDFEGVVLHSAIRGIDVCAEAADGKVCVRAGAGVVWDELVDYCVGRGIHGLENLSGIPGEVGAAAVQNIGAYGAEAKDVISTVEAVDLHDGSMRVFEVTECGYGYRQSVFKGKWRGRYAVTQVCLTLSRRFDPNLEYGGVREALRAGGIVPEAVTPRQLRDTIVSIRQAKLPDPMFEGNAGSFFKNPIVDRAVYARLHAIFPDMPCYDAGDGRVKIPAAWLIERCGWKGRALGHAAVHDRQALVLVNRGGATGQDVLRLCRAVQADVRERFGVELFPEVNIVGKVKE